jgi:hypothetical protein
MLDDCATIDPRERRERVLRVRNALLELLRSWEDLNDLPRSIPTKVERREAPPPSGHHNR